MFFFTPIWGRSPIWANILAQGIFCWIENTPEWFEICKRLGQRRTPRCLSCPAAAWRSWKNLTGRRKGDGVQSCCQLRPIPFKRAHGLPAWRGSCRTSVVRTQSCERCLEHSNSKYQPSPIWFKSQSRQQFDPSTGPARCKHIGNESWKRRLENHRKCKFSSHHHVCSGEWEESFDVTALTQNYLSHVFFPWKGHWT